MTTKRRLYPILLLLLFACSDAFAKNKIQQINHHIDSIKLDLQKATHKKLNVQRALQQTELAESELSQALRSNHRALVQQKHLVFRIENKERHVDVQVTQNKKYLEKQLMTAFIFSRLNSMQTLLDMNSVQSYDHALMDFDFITKAQVHIIQQLQQSFDTYHHIKLQKKLALQKLMTIQQQLLDNKKQLKKTEKNRQALIHLVSQRIHTNQEKLHQLLVDKTRLETTLAALKLKSLKNAMTQQHFQAFKGKLPWPAHGHVEPIFGTQIIQSELKWTGTLIDASLGSSVHPIAMGKVVFAKWLEGYGLLLIIDHGNGYMSIYGRNQSLLKKVGDYVTSAMTIATVGRSGGFEKSALYFALRHNAKPLNPSTWCK